MLLPALDPAAAQHAFAGVENDCLPGRDRTLRLGETPTVIAEFVSRGKRNQHRDYEEKRDEFMAINVSEYWIFDRFKRILTVFTKQAGRIRKRVVKENEVYTTSLLPGFELPADAWQEP